MTEPAADMFAPLPRCAVKSTPTTRAMPDEWQPVLPVPDDAPPLTYHRSDPDGIWDYRNADGQLLHRVVRWNKGDSDKDIFPFVFCKTDDGRRAWRPKHLAAPRPLYGLDRLARHPDAPVLVVEGEKAADAAAQLFPEHIAVTSSGGSNAAGKADWSPLAGRAVTIWPDHDEPGSRYAADVARLASAVGATSIRCVSLPPGLPAGWDLADPMPDGMTAETLAAMVTGAELTVVSHEAEPHDAPEPTPLVRPMPPAKPFAIEALGTLAPAALALNQMVQSPPAMCGNTVLAVATLAAQAHVNVELPIGSGSVRPVSGLFVTVGRTGERKSTTDAPAMQAVRDREAELHSAYECQMKDYKDAREAWEAERKAILSSSRNGGKKVDKASREADLRALGPEPPPPLTPIIVMAEPTIEGLAKLLMTGQPSVGIFSAEGGQFIGGHAMSDDAKLRSAAALSHLWDGEAWKRVRAADGAHTIANRRLALHLLVQPCVAAQLVNDPVLRDQGLVSRMLLTFPETTMGTRLFRDPSLEARAALQAFTTRLASALSLPLPLRDGTRNELAPRTLPLSPEARRQWVDFSNHVERRIGPGGEFEPISGFAAKMAEHAARLAAVMAWWGDHDTREIGGDPLAGAILLVEHYADEALRLHQGSVVPPDIAEADRLLTWLRERWQYPNVSVADIVRVGPNSLRVARRARELVKLLADHGWLRPAGAVTIAGKRRKEAWSIAGQRGSAASLRR